MDHWSSPNGCHPDCPACAASVAARPKGKADNLSNPVAILIETQPMTAEEQRRFESWLLKAAAAQQNIAIHAMQVKRFDPNTGNPVIYIP